MAPSKLWFAAIAMFGSVVLGACAGAGQTQSVASQCFRTAIGPRATCSSGQRLVPPPFGRVRIRKGIRAFEDVAGGSAGNPLYGTFSRNAHLWELG